MRDSDPAHVVEHFHKAPVFYENNNDVAQNVYHRKMYNFVKLMNRFNEVLIAGRVTCVGMFAESLVGYLTLQEDAAKMLKEAPEKSAKFWLKITVSLTSISGPYSIG
mgnify:CR=1 FL=1